MAKEKPGKEKRFEGQVKKGEVRNPYGRLGKPTPDYRKAKAGLLQVFIQSEGTGHISDMLNMKLPAILRPEGRQKVTLEEDDKQRMLLLANFKWAVEQFLKILPKEIGMFGKVSHEYTLAGMVKGALTAPKSDKVIEMTKATEEKILSHQEAPESMEEKFLDAETEENGVQDYWVSNDKEGEEEE